MIRDRDRNELELQQMRSVVDAMDGGLRRFAAGDLSTTIDLSFPIRWEGMRRDFNRGLNALNGTMDSVIGNARLLRDESDTLRKTMTETAEKNASEIERLSGTAATVSTVSQRLREQKARAQHAATIAQNAKLDMQRPREAVAAALQTIEAMSRKPDNDVSKEQLEILSARTQQIGRELDALCLYIDALNDHLGALSEAAENQAGVVSSTHEEMKDIARSQHAVRLKSDMATLALDRMDRQIAEIDQQASRFARVTVITEPPRDPSPVNPGRRGPHLRLVKS